MASKWHYYSTKTTIIRRNNSFMWIINVVYSIETSKSLKSITKNSFKIPSSKLKIEYLFGIFRVNICEGI